MRVHFAHIATEAEVIVKRAYGSWFVVGAALAVMACSSSSGSATGGDAGSATDAGSGDPDSAADDASADSGADSGSMCSAAIDQALGLVNKVATTPVSILSDSGGTRVLYVDASAGGPNNAPNNPYVYVNLETGTRVDVTDPAARTATTWDLALKRYVIYTNGGDGGSGMGGTATSMKDFASVTSADATTFATEVFFDAMCNVLTDNIGGLKTTFSAWFVYDQQTNKLSPAPGVFIVRGATGKLYKVQILNYYATPDGGSTGAGAEIELQVAAL